MVSLIVATDANGVIAIKGENSLPWRCPEDLVYFKKVTDGKVVIMGQSTWFSIPEKLRPLPNRKNIVLTDDLKVVDEEPKYDDLYPCMDIEYSVGLAKTIATKHNTRDLEIIVMGGVSIYRQFIELGLIDKIYINVLKITLDKPPEEVIYFPLSIADLDKNWDQTFKGENNKFTSYIYEAKKEDE